MRFAVIAHACFTLTHTPMADIVGVSLIRLDLPRDDEPPPPPEYAKTLGEQAADLRRGVREIVLGGRGPVGHATGSIGFGSMKEFEETRAKIPLLL